MIQQKRNSWYKDINVWAWIVAGLGVIAIIVITIADEAAEEKARTHQHRPRSYEEVFTPEEARKMGLGGRIDGPGDWKPDPDGVRRFHEFIQNGGNADPALDAIQGGDYHDLLDQNGGPEGF